MYNILGQEVSVVVKSEMAAGSYRERITASGLASGVYFYRLQAKPVNGAPGFTAFKKMVLMK